MIAWVKRGPVTSLVIAVMTCCFASPVCGDELQYLPDKTLIFYSLDLPTFLKSKTGQKSKLAKVFFQDPRNFRIGIPVENVARITRATDGEHEPGVSVYTTTMAINVAEVKKSLDFFMQFKEHKVGTLTIYEREGALRDYQSFCVPESKVLLIGPPTLLKKILERKNAPDLSAGMNAAIKNSGFKDPAIFIADVQSWPEKPRKESLHNAPFPGLDIIFERVQTVIFKASEDDKVRASVTVICKDAEGAAAVKKVVDGARIVFKDKLKDDPTLPAQEQELIKKTRQFLDASEVSAMDKHVSVTLATDPGEFASVFDYWTFPKSRPAKKDTKKAN